MKHLKRYIKLWAALSLTAILLSVDVQAKSTNTLPDSLQQFHFEVNGVAFSMQRVEGGVFVMGGTREQHRERSSIDLPTHLVALDAYYIAQTEVTQALWKAVMPEWELVEEVNLPDFPISYVTWEDCQEFLRRLDSITGLPFRLPTEAEWEYAARGGKNGKSYRFSGGNIVDSVSWGLNNAGFRRHVVAQKKPNELGLYDMTGNVSEWCSDWLGTYCLGTEPNPKGPKTGTFKVVRGSSFDDCKANSYISRRAYHEPDQATNYIGLRLAFSLPNEPTLIPTQEPVAVKKVKIGKVRMKFLYVPAEQLYYIAEEPVTWRTWTRIMAETPEGKPTFAVTQKNKKEWQLFLEECRRKSLAPLDWATEQEVKLAMQAKLLHQPKVETLKQRNWEKDINKIQKRRRVLKKAEAWFELIDMSVSIPDDPILKSYNDEEDTNTPRWLVLRSIIPDK